MFNVEQWLDGNQLSIDIFNKKYRRDNETDAEWLDRVSGGNEYIAELIKEKKFIFGGRILANRGKEQTTSNCFTEDAIVNTKRGLIPIKDIVAGDYVVTAGGTYERVNAIMSREYEGDMFVIKSKNILNPITCTPNHQYLTNKGWVRADRLMYKENHMLTVASVPHSNTNYGIFDLSTLEMPDKINIIANDNSLSYSVNMTMKGKDCQHKSGNTVKRFINLDDPDFRYLIGRWLGDGSVTRRKGCEYDSIVQIVFNATTEVDSANRIESIFRNTFGVDVSRTTTKQNVIAIRVENPFIGMFFSTMFGKGCSNKSVPYIFDGDIVVASGLFDADGIILSHGAVRITLKNIGLIEWLRKTLYKNGIYTTEIIKHNKYDDTYSLHVPSSISRHLLVPLLSKNYYDGRHNKKYNNEELSKYIPISDIEILENQKCTVYNISVENDHSYTVNGVIVHNCFIMPECPDSIDGIMQMCKEMATTYKSGGGCGFCLDKIRPKGAKIHGQENTHPGLVDFMKLFSSVTGSIKGNNRRGALMLLLDAMHPDVLDFINAKRDKNNGITNANISVKMSDEFMIKAGNKTVETRKWLIEATGEELEYTIDYEKVYNEIVDASRQSAEPGIVFWDTSQGYTLCSDYEQYKIIGLNPCAEVSGIAYDACLLGSINVSAYFQNKEFQMDAFSYDVRQAVYALNQVQKESLDRLPLEQQRDTASRTHQIGLGICGLATLFLQFGVKYGSQEAIAITGFIMHKMINHAVRASATYAKSYGTFDGYDYDKTKKSSLWIHLDKDTKDLVKAYGLYNLKLLSIAPTGTISTLLNVSSGIEPYFKLSYKRVTESLNDGEKKEYIVDIPLVKKWKEENNTDILPEYFVESHDINWKDRVMQQASAQRYVDNSISSTINLPKGTTNEEIAQLYNFAWNNGLKGLTIYVDGSLDSQVLKSIDDEDTTIEKPKSIIYKEKVIEIGCGKIIMLIGYDEHTNQLHDYYTIRTGKGGCVSNINTLAIVVSKYMKGGLSLQDLLDSLDGSEGCNSFTARRAKGDKLSKGKNCGTAMINALIDMQNEINKNTIISNQQKPSIATKNVHQIKNKPQPSLTMDCDLCGGIMVSDGGCFVCECGNSACD